MSPACGRVQSQEMAPLHESEMEMSGVGGELEGVYCQEEAPWSLEGWQAG